MEEGPPTSDASRPPKAVTGSGDQRRSRSAPGVAENHLIDTVKRQEMSQSAKVEGNKNDTAAALSLDTATVISVIPSHDRMLSYHLTTKHSKTP